MKLGWTPYSLMSELVQPINQGGNAGYNSRPFMGMGVFCLYRVQIA